MANLIICCYLLICFVARVSGVSGCDAEAVVRDGANAAVGRERATPSQRRGRLHPRHGRAPGHRQPEAGQRHVKTSVLLCDTYSPSYLWEVRRKPSFETHAQPRTSCAQLCSVRWEWRWEGAEIATSSCISLAQLIIKQQSDRRLRWETLLTGERLCLARTIITSLAFWTRQEKNECSRVSFFSDQEYNNMLVYVEFLSAQLNYAL